MHIEHIDTHVLQKLRQQLLSQSEDRLMQQVEANAEETVTFCNSNIPEIEAGNHFIEIDHNITVKGEKTLLGSKTVEIYVSGPRFTIPGTYIHSVYPARNSSGQYAGTLPYIALNRDTIPWERSNGTNTGKEIPWLALLVFRSDELVKVSDISKLSESSDGPAEFYTCAPDKIGYTPEGGGDMPDMINVIKLNNCGAKFKAITDHLQTLTHVIHDVDEQGIETHRAVILANRLPKAGENCIVHLVSLEKGWADRVVSLYHWKFHCDEDIPSFNRLKDVKTRGFRVEADQLPPQMQKGFVPLEHYIIDGAKTVSWFHGPLVPLFKSGEMPSISRDNPHRASDFLQADNNAGNDPTMLDVSYAAAWELGRLLTLENKAVAMDLFRFKRQQAQGLKAKHAMHEDFPVQLKAPEVDYPDSIQHWLDELASLRAIPLNYLISHPGLLPEESFQFVRLDYNWIYHLQHGALAVGEAWEKPQPDNFQNQSINWIDRNTDDNMIPGFILRSQVVADYPVFVKEAYDSNGNQLEKIIERKLDNGTLLCLFKGVIEEAKIYQHAKAMHYGFNLEDGKYMKEIKTISDGEINYSTAVDFSSYIDADNGFLDVKGIYREFGIDPADSANSKDFAGFSDFGFKMTEGYPQFSFKKN